MLRNGRERAGAVVAEVVPHEGAEMGDDANVGGREREQFVARVTVQLFCYTRNTKMVADATRTSKDRDSGRPLKK